MTMIIWLFGTWQSSSSQSCAL